MTVADTVAQTAARLAFQADRSQEQADAYRHLAHLLVTDPKLAPIVQFELDSFTQDATEYQSDADDLRERALALGYVPA